MITGVYKDYPEIEKPMGYFKFFFLALLATFVVTAFLFEVNHSTNSLGFAAMVTGFAIVPVAFFCVPYQTIYAVRRSRVLAKQFNEKIALHFPKAINKNFLHANYNPGMDGSPCCIAYDGNHIIIMHQATYAILGWDDIRSWSYELGGAQKTIGGHASQQGLQAVDDLVANARTAQNSGLTLTVSNIENPTWFFPTGYGSEAKKVCERWMEILKQIDEGSLHIEKTASR